jgi:uncharacterized RDD family membrane protein YckC
MDQILDSPIGADRKLNFAGFWIRFAALIIDYILIIILLTIVSAIINGGFDSGEESPGATVVFLLSVVLYFPGMESSTRQATIGKMAVGIKVGDVNGNQISFLNAFGRFAAKLISSFMLYIGFMMAGWDEKKQALHDKLANTYVFYA